MRNQIPCSAERLSLLNPPMIQSVVEARAFQIGNQYITDNRVRIVEADDVQITSAVIGHKGLYEQTIRLKDGRLVTKCSCTLVEEPMCRHCIAVLLENYRYVQPRIHKKQRESQVTEPLPDEKGTKVSVADVKLSDIMMFMEWLQPAVTALERSQPLPDTPKQLSAEVAAWIRAFQGLEERTRESQENQVAFETERKDREAYLARLTQQLQKTVEESTVAQVRTRELEHDLGAYKTIMTRLADLSNDVGSFDLQMKTMAGELSVKGTQLDSLAASFKEVAAALKALTKMPPS